jgi:hypothetical protein
MKLYIPKCSLKESSMKSSAGRYGGDGALYLSPEILISGRKQEGQNMIENIRLRKRRARGLAS